MPSIKLSVCQAPAELDPGSRAWTDFARTVRQEQSEVVLLNEMPFGSWIAGTRRGADNRQLEASWRAHDEGIARLGELGAETVLGSRAVQREGRSLNEAFVWTKDDGYIPVHTKQFFPEEDGYWEASWFERGDSRFNLVHEGDLKAGFLICTDLMFNEWARRYGRLGANLIAVPRATPLSSVRRWRTAMSMAAIVSGCYVASSNRAGTDSHGQEFGAHGWIVDPGGDVIAETSEENPVATASIDLGRVATAQLDYPCYVKELD